MVDGQVRIHAWIYVIIPTQRKSPIPNTAPDSVALFSAFCKACRTYFTEELDTSFDGSGMLSPSTLPRYGCEPISEDIELLG